MRDFSREELEIIFDTARDVESNPENYKNIFKDRRVALLFFEPSTRTYNSFKAAAEDLGCKINSIQDPSKSSIAKGETINDTVKTIEGYETDCIIIRDKHMGIAKYVAEIVDIPVINAGDGSREHPTQAMTDLYTILKERGKVDDLRIGILGDLKYGRTCSSLSYGLSKYKNVEIVFIAPKILRVRPEVKLYLKEKDVKYKEVEHPKDVIEDLDVLYVTRIQRERFPDPTEYEKVRGVYRISLELIESNERLGVMHPLPRVDELSTDIDFTSHAWYFKQERNGLPLRKALLYLIFGGNHEN